MGWTMAFTEGQITGSIVTLLIFILLYVISLITPLLHRETGAIPFLTRNPSAIAVELAGDCINSKGIYFLPEGTKVRDFLKLNGELAREYSDKISEIMLLSGDSIMLVRDGLKPPEFILKEMNAAQKIMLGLPIDINNVAEEDIKLIPGIGEKTAVQIIALRGLSGKINNLNELMKIKGIKEKRLTKLKQYLYVDKRYEKGENN